MAIPLLAPLSSLLSIAINGRDDLESLAFLLMYLVHGRLPLLGCKVTGDDGSWQDPCHEPQSGWVVS